MTKNLKYLIFLFLAFGLMVNDGALDSQSNSADYYQFSNVILRRELNCKRSKLYVFHQIKPDGSEINSVFSLTDSAFYDKKQVMF
ncbi:hypothetical protein EKM02_01555 [Flavobacterium sp. RSP49]|uniref:hypothetical protein n=1 Tax=Flavobacterium sp. RSP49 TaxID=2497487 RepID=UPI000F81BA18|nr:hypothetical protein [Flavobacterium sp. RSP49]RTZ02763.1 hypothetical protein EKM02_01555 [Flavobacterium sp. RSP49]